jgi:acetyl-CoA carboxylase biotin carboxyl carrier protein
VDFKEIKKIVELMDEHGLSQFKLEQDETKLELKKGSDVDMQAIQQLMASAPAQHYAAPAPIAGSAVPVAGEPAGLPAGVEEITSPMVGTFYAASSPDSDDFVKVGSKVSADSPVCIVEAMKVMNEIQADISGEIVEILVETGSAVQYGEALFRVKTS